MPSHCNSADTSDNVATEQLYNAAIEQFKRAGTTHFAEWRYQQATACYTQAIELIEQQKQKQQSSASASAAASSAAPHPSLAALLSNRSASYLKQGDAAAALADADACIAANSQWFKAYLRRIAALEEQGKLPEALATCEAAVDALGPQCCEEITLKLEALRTAIDSAAPAVATKKQKGGKNKKAKLPLVCGVGLPYGTVPRGSRSGHRVTQRAPTVYAAHYEPSPSAGGAADVDVEMRRAGIGRPRLYPSAPQWPDAIPSFVKACVGLSDQGRLDIDSPEMFEQRVCWASLNYHLSRHTVLAGCRLEAAYYDRMDTPMTMAEHTAIVEACCVVTLSEAFKALLATESGKVAKYTRTQLLTMGDDYREAPRAPRIQNIGLNLKIDFPIRCSWCAAVLDLPDPPMCECAEAFFCSKECHAADYVDGGETSTAAERAHTISKCARTRADLGPTGSKGFDVLYWFLCSVGLLRWPHDELRNFSLLWKADKRFSDPKSSTYMDELAFLVERERAMFEERLEALIAEWQVAQQPHLFASRCEMILSWYVRMSDCAPAADSAARRRFKLQMLPVLWRYMTDMNLCERVRVPYDVAVESIERNLIARGIGEK